MTVINLYGLFNGKILRIEVMIEEEAIAGTTGVYEENKMQLYEDYLIKQLVE